MTSQALAELALAHCASAHASATALRLPDAPTQCLLSALQRCLAATPLSVPLALLAPLRARLFAALHANPTGQRLPQDSLRELHLALACLEAALLLLLLPHAHTQPVAPAAPDPATHPAALALQALDTAALLSGPHHALLRELMAAAQRAALAAGVPPHSAPPLPSLPLEAVAATAAAAEAATAASAPAALLPTLTLPSALEFEGSALRPGLPLRIRGALAHWPALAPPTHPGAPDRRWHSLEYLARAAGLRTVPVEEGSSAECGYLAPGFDMRLWRLGEYLASVMAPSVTEYLRSSSNSSCTSSSTSSSTSCTPYLAQHALFDTCPQLALDICTPDYIFCATDIDGSADGSTGQPHEPSVSIKAWLGPSGTYTPLHCDATHNLLAQVVGVKRVRLLAPCAAPHLYAAPQPLANTSQLPRGALAAVAAAGGCAPAAFAAAEAGGGGGSGAGALQPFPLLRHCTQPLLETTLRPGDLLFIPRGWWHEVEALTPSFSVSFWW